MNTRFILQPRLSERITAAESRTEAFAKANFGERRTSVAVELFLPPAPNDHHMLMMEIVLDLCLRMDPIVAEVRVFAAGRTSDLSDVVTAAATRLPLERRTTDAALPTIRFAIGENSFPYVDANDWHLGFNAVVAQTSNGFNAGAIFGALEAAKHLFLRAVAVAYDSDATMEWPCHVFDLLTWSRGSHADERVVATTPLPPLALVGCGGVGAGYLWFLRKSGLKGRLLLIDDDKIAWHNMNRLFFATVADADATRRKVESARDYMNPTWDVVVVPRKAEHDEPSELVARPHPTVEVAARRCCSQESVEDRAWNMVVFVRARSMELDG